ncbi:hypothetical protein [Lysobacter sp. CA199]|uniref:hypothetical protein n=1 Tax=Lysobacter sp. CA199 TaxID=3455608 RepID=UPI003F8D76DF
MTEGSAALYLLRVADRTFGVGYRNRAHRHAFRGGAVARCEGMPERAPYGVGNRLHQSLRAAWLDGYQRMRASETGAR